MLLSVIVPTVRTKTLRTTMTDLLPDIASPSSLEPPEFTDPMSSNNGAGATLELDTGNNYSVESPAPMTLTMKDDKAAPVADDPFHGLNGGEPAVTMEPMSMSGDVNGGMLERADSTVDDNDDPFGALPLADTTGDTPSTGGMGAFGSFDSAQASSPVVLNQSEDTDELVVEQDVPAVADAGPTEQAVADGTALLATTTVSQDDEFGDFGAAAVSATHQSFESGQSTDMKSATVPDAPDSNVQDDDEFGDFGSPQVKDNVIAEIAPEIEAVVSQIGGAVPEDVIASDNVLAFDEGVTTPEAVESDEVVEETLPVQAQEEDEDDDFGDFEDTTTTTTDIPVMDTAAASIESPLVQQEVPIDDSMPAVADDAEQEPDSATLLTTTVLDDDGIGEFEAAASSGTESFESELASEIGLTMTPAAATSQDENDAAQFGDFDGPPVEETTSDEIAPAIEPAASPLGSTGNMPEDGQGNEDSLAVDAGATTLEPVESDEVADEHPHQVQPQEEVADDSFGDFEDTTTTAAVVDTASIESPPVQPEVSIGASMPAVADAWPTDQVPDSATLLATTVSHDDEFGAFGAAEAVTSDDEDAAEFGGFDGPQAQVEDTSIIETVESTSQAVEEVVDTDAQGDDSFGAFDEAATPAQSGEVSPDDKAMNQEKTQEENGNESFGDFDGAEATEPATNDIDQSNDAVPEAADMSTGPGAFGSAEAANDPVGDAEPTSDVAPVGAEGDEFGGFGDAPKAVGAEPSLGDHQDDVGATATAGDDQGAPMAQNGDEEDFGGFGGAIETFEMNHTPSVGQVEGHDDVCETTTELNQSDSASHNDEDFGGFGEATQTAEVDESAPAADPDEDHDDFGDFGEANETPEVDESAPAAQDEDDGGFGDFGDSDETPEVDERAPASHDEDDDDFGDFGGANETPAAEQSAPAPEDDDDAFGDFGEASGTAEVDQNAPAAVQDEGDDSFGDFDEAAVVAAEVTQGAPAHQDEDDDFGDFGDAADAEPVEDPLLNRMRNDLPKLFARYAEDDAGSLQTETESTVHGASEDVTIQSILVSDLKFRIPTNPIVFVSHY